MPTAQSVDAEFDQIFSSYLAAFSGDEVASAFAAQGVTVEEADEKHFAESQPGDDDWSGLEF